MILRNTRTGFGAPSRRAVVGGLICGGLTGACASYAAPESKAAASSVLTEAMAGSAAPGMAAMVIRNYQPEPEIVAGVRRLGQPAMIAPGDRWHLGSNGKAMTATMIARLVEKGVLSWDAPLIDMAPQFAISMHEAYRDVTLPDLLSHRSGLPENHSDLEFFMGFIDDPAPLPQQRLRYVSAALAESPAGPKRADPSYSNTGVILAGVIAETKTGIPFETLIAAEVLKPLGIKSFDFGQFGGAGEPVGHIDGRVADQPRDANPKMIAPAGGMRMTLKDWSKFCIDHLRGEQGEGRLLKTETYRFLHKGQGDTRSALGWGASPTPLKRKGPGLVHSGSDGNWFALVLLFPETGNGALVVANAAESMGGDGASVSALRALAEMIAEPAPEE
ncbi:serine hydrolase domain-containing protein [Hyphococcus sp.]|uniref:serine hydrolase domain-containing protein n=1 Tax=Hyphococcus sp. TaxID=2038636 RepID=UPI00208780EE|nr:MAG: serine hydrolase [Marinicaulis sp.]